MHRTRIGRVGAAALGLFLFVGACGDDDTPTDTTSPVEDSGPEDTAPEDSGPDESAPEDSAPEEPAPEGTVIDVSVAGGQVTGGGRHTVPLGDTVTIVVTSDVPDHVHLHGYDVMVDVTPGEPAELTFDATIPGVFEVELEDTALPLLELEVS